MANIYVRSTDGNNADDGSTWALAKATLAGADAIDAAGDTIYVSQAHSESTAGGVTLLFAGTPASPTRLLGASDAAEPPTALSTAPTVATTGANALNINGSLYAYGINFIGGDSTGNGPISLQSANANVTQKYEECSFYLRGANSGSRINIGTGVTANSAVHVLKNGVYRFSQAGQGFALSASRVEISGGSIHASSTALTTALIRSLSSGRASFHTFNGVDLSNMGSAANLLDTAGLTSASRVIFRNCKLPASWSGSLISGAVTVVGARAEMHNCDSADTNYRLWVEDYAGSIKTETTIVKTGGSTDGTTPYSLKMATSANASYPTVPLESIELPARWNSTTGSAVTVTVDVVHDSVTNLKDDEIWLEVQYLGTSGFPLSSFVNDCKADVLATAANQTASSATWTTTGLTNPNKQKLEVTFTPREAGFIQARVFLAKASTTVYVDNKLQVS
jgi:hypothetical protein